MATTTEPGVPHERHAKDSLASTAPGKGDAIAPSRSDQAAAGAAAAKRNYCPTNPDDSVYDGAAAVVEAERAHIRQWRGREPQLGIALSGGGIRSASYALGALQALANDGSFEKFDYLSTVSGGGYTGASLTYLLHQSQKQAEAAGGRSADFDATRDRFPYLSYPMVSAYSSEMATSKGRLLRRLRQNAKYLAPGKGITVLSLVGVVLRNSMVSAAVHAALLALLLQGLIRAGLLPRNDQDPIRILQLSGIAFTALVVFSAAYAVSTRFFDTITQWRDHAAYDLRRAFERWAHRLLVLGLVTLLLAAVPYAHRLIVTRTLPGWLAVLLPDNGNERLTVFGVLSTVAGAIGNIWGFLQARNNQATRIPTGLLVGIGSFALLFGILLLIFHGLLLWNSAADATSPLLLWALAVLFLLGMAPDVNYLSIHRFYRDRLMETFMPDLDTIQQTSSEASGQSNPANRTMMGELCGAPGVTGPGRTARGPYHLINSNIVLVSSEHSRYRGRGGDNFILSPLYSGSRATGWKPTNPSLDEGLSLATAMAVSGAAISPNAAGNGVGVTRQPLLSVLMGLFNIRLGYWHRNPDPQPAIGTGSGLQWLYAFLWSLFSLQKTPNMLSPGLFESFGRFNLKEVAPYVLLSDGGHFENLGLYELVRRRLKLIVVCDAGADPDFKFDDLANAIAKVRADFGTLIEISSEDLDVLVPHGPAKEASANDALPMAQRGYLLAKIRYASRGSQRASAETGVLVYLKSTFFKELPADLHGYRRAHPSFPDQPTGDQFFDEKQFEAYRELGFQTLWRLLKALRSTPTDPAPANAPNPELVRAALDCLQGELPQKPSAPRAPAHGA